MQSGIGAGRGEGGAGLFAVSFTVIHCAAPEQEEVREGGGARGPSVCGRVPGLFCSEIAGISRGTDGADDWFDKSKVS